MKEFENMVIHKDDMAFYQTNNENAWLGPARVTDVDNNYIFIAANGDRRKVQNCNMKLNVKNSNDDDKIVGIDEKEAKIKRKMK